MLANEHRYLCRTTGCLYPRGADLRVLQVGGKRRFPPFASACPSRQPARCQAIDQDDGDAMQDRELRSALAHIVQQGCREQAHVLVTRGTQRTVDVQSMALVTASHAPKERRLCRRQGIVDDSTLAYRHAAEHRPEKLPDPVAHTGLAAQDQAQQKPMNGPQYRPDHAR